MAAHPMIPFHEVSDKLLELEQRLQRVETNVASHEEELAALREATGLLVRVVSAVVREMAT